jgi:ABC-type glycerol-3-phosphate transport system substrate-binding protein
MERPSAGVLRRAGRLAATLAGLAAALTSAVFQPPAAEAQPKTGLVYMTVLRDDKLNAIVSRYEQRRPDIEIKPIRLATDGTRLGSDAQIARFDGAMAAGERVDVYDGGMGGTGIIRPRALDGKLLALDDYIALDHFDIDEYFPKGSTTTCTYGGKLYTLPLSKQIYPVYYNLDMFKAAGLAPPGFDWTLDDLRAYAKKLTSGEGDRKVYGAWIPVDWGWLAGVPAQVAGWEAYVEKDGVKSPNFDDSRIRKTLEVFYQMSMQDKSNPASEEISRGRLDMAEFFATGRTAMIVGNAWALGDLQRKRAQGSLKFTMGVAPLPRVDRTVTKALSASEYGLGLAVPGTAKEAWEAYRFIKFVTLECADILREIPASPLADRRAVLGFLGSYIDPTGKKYEGVFGEDELAGLFDERPGMKSYYGMKEDAYIGPLWDLFAEDALRYLAGSISLDGAIADMTKRGQGIIDRVSAGSKR